MTVLTRIAASSLLERVQALAPEIAARADETEQNRGLPADLVARLREAGLFRMMIPAEYGGEELDLMQAVRVVETLAQADGAAGWNAMIVFGFNVGLGRFPVEVVKEVLAGSGDVLVRGGLAPLGRATPVDGGYLVNGQWPFASGSYQPQWVMASSLILDEGGPRMAPSGMPEICMALLPAHKAQFLDTWYTSGLRGSSSDDFQVKDQFVAETYTTNLFDFSRPSAFDTPLLRLPFPALTGPTHSAVVIGVAQAAIDELTELSRTKRSAFNPMQVLGADPVFQNRLGELAVRVQSLRAAMDKQVEGVLAAAEAGAPPSLEALASGGALVSHTHVQCVDIVNEAFALAGSAPVYSKTPLQRRWRDVRCAAQHVGASPANFQRYGAALVSGQPVQHRH